MRSLPRPVPDAPRASLPAALSIMFTLAACLSGCEPVPSDMPDAFNPELVRLRVAAIASPRAHDVRVQLAAVYLDVGDPADAEEENRRALTLGAPRDAVLPALGQALLAQGRFQSALDAARTAGTPDSPALLCVRANALIGLKDRAGASQLFDEALRKRKDFPDALIGLGRLAHLAGDDDAAGHYAERALAAAPRHIEALQFQGDLLAARNAPAAAIAVYDRLLSINPRYLWARLGKAYLHTAQGAFAEAQADIDAARLVNPRSVLLFYTQALLHFGEGKGAQAQDEILQVLRVAPEHLPSLLLAGAISLALDADFQAEDYLQRYLERHPDNLYARKLLASALLRTRQADTALEVLQPAMKVRDADPELLALSGESYMQVRKFTQAQLVFERAATLQPASADLRSALGLSRLGAGDAQGAVEDMRRAAALDRSSPRTSIPLIRTMLALGHVDEAIRTATVLAQGEPRNATAHDLLGEAYSARGNLRQARTRFEQALALEPAYFPAVRHLVDVDVREHAPDAARARVLAFLQNDKTSIDAMGLLAALAQRQGQAAEATQWLERASAARPGATPVAVALLTRYVGMGDVGKALDLAGRLLVTAPGNADVLDLLGKAQLANHEDDKALITFKQLAVILPRSAQAKMQVAAVQLKLNRSDEARETLNDALAIQPDLPAAQLLLAEMYIGRGWYERALLVAQRLQKAHPDESAGYQLEGDVLMGRHQPARALAQFDRALALRPTSKLAVKAVAALRAAGKPAEGAARLASWLRDRPTDAWVALYRAETQMTDQQYQDAALTLESIVEREPRNLVALNNLALAYQRLHDARARTQAESAYALAGDQPAVMDTLGWILVEGNDTARGVALLRKALAQARDDCAIRFHLATGLLKSGDRDGARQQMQALVDGRTPCAQQEEARSLLARW